MGELGRASSEAHQQAQSDARGRACPIKPDMPAALALSLTAASAETLAKATELSHSRIPDPQKLGDNTRFFSSKLSSL